MKIVRINKWRCYFFFFLQMSKHHNRHVVQHVSTNHSVGEFFFCVEVTSLYRVAGSILGYDEKKSTMQKKHGNYATLLPWVLRGEVVAGEVAGAVHGRQLARHSRSRPTTAAGRIAPAPSAPTRRTGRRGGGAAGEEVTP